MPLRKSNCSITDLDDLDELDLAGTPTVLSALHQRPIANLATGNSFVDSVLGNDALHDKMTATKTALL